MKRIREPFKPFHPIPIMTDDQWICWFAGIIDGEGSIWVSNKTVTKTGKRTSRAVCVSVGNTDRRMIEAIYPRIGMGRTWCERRSGNPRRMNNGDIWVWRVRNMVECERVIQMVYPFLVCKKEAADFALADIDARLHGPERKRDEAKRLSASGVPHKDIATRMGMSRQWVSLVVRGHTWPSCMRNNEHNGRTKHSRSH